MDARRYFLGLSDRVDQLRRDTEYLAEEPDPYLNLSKLAERLGALARDLDEKVDEAIKDLTTEKSTTR